MTAETVKEFMSQRPLEWQGNPRVPRADRVVPVVSNADGAAEGEDGEKKMTKNQLKKLAKEKQIAEKKAAKEKEKADKAAAAAEGQ